jgi:phosphohistidine phosphatase
MDLYIFRHGIAEDRSQSGRDEDRELTPEGIAKTRSAGRALRKLGVELDLVLSSPFARAWRTAEVLVEQLETPEKLRRCEEMASGMPPAPVLAELKRRSREFRSIMIVGHEPDLSQLISLLLSGFPSLSITMKKGGLCKLACLALEPGAATLEWHLTPKLLERLA